MDNQLKKLGDITDNDFRELKLVLIHGAKNYLGISNLPDEYDLIKMCEFLSTHFKDFTAHEIDKALSMYASGSISVLTQPYGVMGMKFLSDVLHEFRLHRKSWKDFNLRRENETKLLSAPVENIEEKGKNLYNFLINFLNDGNEMPDLYAWDEVFLYLEKEKIIELSTEDKIDFMNLVKEEIRDEIEYCSKQYDKKELLKELLKLLSNEKALASLCRKKLVILHINNLQLQNQKTNDNGNNE